jgi:hypothetical protein
MRETAVRTGDESVGAHAADAGGVTMVGGRVTIRAEQRHRYVAYTPDDAR